MCYKDLYFDISLCLTNQGESTSTCWSNINKRVFAN